MQDHMFSDLDHWNIMGIGQFPASILTFSTKMEAATLVDTLKFSFIFNLCGCLTHDSTVLSAFTNLSTF